MGEVNLYIHEPCAASVEVAQKVRAWRTPNPTFQEKTGNFGNA